MEGKENLFKIKLEFQENAISEVFLDSSISFNFSQQV